MPRRIPEDIDIQLARAYLKGWTRDEAAAKYRVAAGTVSDRWTQFERLFGPDGKALRELSLELNKTGVTATQAATGARIAATLSKMDIDEDRLREFVSKIYQESIERGHRPEEVVERAITLRNLETQTGKTYEEMIRFCEEKSKEAAELEGKVERLKAEAAVARRDRESALREKDATIKTLNEYVKVREGLEAYGQNIQNTSKLLNMLRNSEEQGYDAENIAKSISDIENLSKSLENLQSEVETLKEEKAKLEVELDGLREEKAGKERELQEMVRRIKEMRVEEKTLRDSLRGLEHLREIDVKISSHGITPARLDRIIERGLKLDELGFTQETAEILASELEKKGLDPHKSVTSLINLILKHRSLEDAIANSSAELSRLQQNIEVKKAELTPITTQIEDTRSRLEELKDQVDEYKHLTEEQEKIHSRRIKQLEEEYDTRRRELESLCNKLIRERKALIEDIKNLENQRQAIQTSLAEAEATLKEMENRLSKTRAFITFAQLMKEPNAPIDQTELLKLLLGLVEGAKTNLKANPEIGFKLRSQLKELSRTLVGELRVATQHTE